MRSVPGESDRFPITAAGITAAIAAREVAVPDRQLPSTPDVVLPPSIGQHALVDVCRRRLVSKTGVSAIMAVSLSIGVLAKGVPTPADAGRDSGYSAYFAPDKPDAPHTALVAETVRPISFALVNLLLSEPTNPDVENYSLIMDTYMAQHPNDTSDVAVAYTDNKIRQEAAQQEGLTVFDATPTLAIMDNDLARPSPELSADDFVRLANAFLAKYGNLSIGPENGLAFVDNLQAPAPADLQSTTYKQWVVSIIRAISALPKEQVRLLGVERFVPAGVVPNPTGFVPGAYISANPDGPYGRFVVFNVKSGSDPELVWHEILGHRMDFILSGGVIDDNPQFEASDHGAPYGGRDTHTVAARSNGFYTLQDLNRTEGNLERAMAAFLNKPNCSAVASIFAKSLALEGQRTIYESDYAGQVSQAEHHAETYKYIPDGYFYPMLLSSLTPNIAYQLRYGLAALAQEFPRFARFYIDQADHGPSYDTSAVFASMCQTALGGGK